MARKQALSVTDSAARRIQALLAKRGKPSVGVRIGVRSHDKPAVERFTREIAPLILNGPPSVTGFAGGRPKPEEIVAYWPALLDKSMVEPCVELVEV